MPNIRRRVPSPAFVISLVALVLAVGSGTFAVAALSHRDKKVVKKIVDREINRRAPGLSVGHASSAGTASVATQLGEHGAGDYLLAHSRGVALAGAKVAADGTVEAWFNALGGAPTVEVSAGTFYMTFPGLANTSQDVIQATLSGDGQIAAYDSNGGKEIAVQTSDSTGVDQLQAFYVVIYGASPNG